MFEQMATLNKRIEVWQTNSQSDGTGGKEAAADNIITTTWAKLESLDDVKVTALGLSYAKESLLVTTRKREDFQFNSKLIYIKYRDIKYTIASFPTNEDFIDAFITFVAQSEKLQSYTIYEEIT